MQLSHVQRRAGLLLLAAILTLTIMFGSFFATKTTSAHAAAATTVPVAVTLNSPIFGAVLLGSSANPGAYGCILASQPQPQTINVPVNTNVYWTAYGSACYGDGTAGDSASGYFHVGTTGFSISVPNQ